MHQELSSITALLNRVQMNPADRAAAAATAERAEALAEAVYRGIKAVEAAAQSVGHGTRVLAQRVRARFA